MTNNIPLPFLAAEKTSIRVTPLGLYLRKLRVEHDQLLKNMADSLGLGSAQLSGIEHGKREIPDEDKFIEQLLELYQIEDKVMLERLVKDYQYGSVSKFDTPELDMKTLINERVASGQPLIIIEPTCTSPELVKALKQLLPESSKNKVTFINFDA